jgi:hypothetical protein
MEDWMEQPCMSNNTRYDLRTARANSIKEEPVLKDDVKGLKIRTLKKWGSCGE